VRPRRPAQELHALSVNTVWPNHLQHRKNQRPDLHQCGSGGLSGCVPRCKCCQTCCTL
jgi:hypothetical protein